MIKRINQMKRSKIIKKIDEDLKKLKESILFFEINNLDKNII